METQENHQETRKKAHKYIIAAFAAIIAVVLVISIVKSQAKKTAEAEISHYIEQAEAYLKSLPESYWKIGYRVDSEIARVYYIGGNLNNPLPDDYELHCFDLKDRTKTIVKKFNESERPNSYFGYDFVKAVKYDTMIFIQSNWDDGILSVTALNTNNNTVRVLFDGEVYSYDDAVIYTKNEIIINVYYATIYSSYYYSLNEYANKTFVYQIGTDISDFYANVRTTMKQLSEEADRRGQIAEEREKREEAKQQMVNSQNNVDNTLNDLKRVDAEYKQLLQDYSTATDPMWKAQRLQAMYYKNESCIAYAQKIGNQNLVNGYIERRRAIENLMRY